MATKIIGNGPGERILVSSKVVIPTNARVGGAKQPIPSHDRMTDKEKLKAGWTKSDNCITSPCRQIMHHGKGGHTF